MYSFALAQPHRALFFRIVAYGDDSVKILVAELIHTLQFPPVPNTDLLQRLERQRMYDSRRLRTRRKRPLYGMAGVDDCLCHL